MPRIDAGRGDTARVQIESVAGRSSLELTVSASVSTLLQRLRLGLATQRRLSLKGVDGTVAHLRARVNWATWGAKIEVRFVTLQAETTRVEARWVPVIGTTIFVWGQGKRDLRALESMLTT